MRKFKIQPTAVRSVGSGVIGIGGSVKKVAASPRMPFRRDHDQKGEVPDNLYQRTKIEVPLR